MSEATSSLDNLYLIGGRIDGDEDDVTLVVASDQGLGRAKQIFKHKLLALCADNEGQEEADYVRDNGLVYLTFARPLAAVAREPLTSPGRDELRALPEEQDNEIHPGW